MPNATAAPSAGNSFATGVRGSALHANNQGIVLADADLSGTFTIALWVNELGLSSDDGEFYVVYGLDGADQKIGIGRNRFNGNSKLKFYLNDLDAITVPFDESTKQNQWFHYALTFDGQDATAYIDGDAVGTVQNVLPAADAGYAGLATHWWGGGSAQSTRLNAYLDDFHVLDQHLTADQITALMNGTTNFETCTACAEAAVCGNGIVDLGEECDDGNTTGGDECSAECEIVMGIDCADIHQKKP